MRQSASLVWGLVLSLACLGCQKEPASGTSASNAAASAVSPQEKQKPAVAAAGSASPDEKLRPMPTSAPASQPKAVGPSLVDNLEPGQSQIYGSPFAIAGDPVALASAIGASGESQGPVKVAASIDKVCQKKGCWFTLTAPDVSKPVRVRMKEYAFLIPRNVMGAKVVVEGTLSKREIPVAEAQHYADESGGQPKVVKAPQSVHEFTATTVQVTTSS